MATPFFGKRDSTLPVSPNHLRQSSPNSLGGVQSGSTNSSGSSLTGSRPADDGTVSTTSSPASMSSPPLEGGSKLTVGPNIKLKGVEITDCDTLVVEGLVEATMDSRVMQIAEQGAFKGSADIDVAEIRGQFNGNLTARQKLVIYSTGKVTGTVRYGKLVIEEGGQLAGEVLFGITGKPAAGLVQVSAQAKAA